MTTSLLSLGTQVYTAGKHSFSITISTSTTSLNFSLTRQNWPSGIAINSTSLTDPQGRQVAAAGGIEGGALLDKNGNPATTQDMPVSAPDGQTLVLGVYNFTMDVAQTLTTAISITAEP